jgi:hypothetical protein
MAVWRMHANEKDNRGAANLDDNIVMHISLLCCYSPNPMGLQRWECYWNGKTKALDCSEFEAHVQMMSTGTFNHILYAIRDVGSNINATQDPMPDGQHPQLTCFHLCGWMTPAVCSTECGHKWPKSSSSGPLVGQTGTTSSDCS